MDPIDRRHAEWEKALYNRDVVSRGGETNPSTATLLTFGAIGVIVLIGMISFIVQTIWLALF